MVGLVTSCSFLRIEFWTSCLCVHYFWAVLYVLPTYSVSYFHQLAPFWIEEGKGKIALTGHSWLPRGHPVASCWESLDLGLNLWVQHPELHSRLWSEKSYDWGIVDHETIMTEVVFMVKFTSNKYLAAFFLNPPHEREETKGRKWLREVPWFALYWPWPYYWCCFWYYHACRQLFHKIVMK